MGLEEYVIRETKLEDYTRPNDSEGQRLILTTDSGFGALYESGVLTETHRIQVKAFDRAGNEAESEPVQILVMHKPKEKKTSALWDEPAVAVVDDGLTQGRELDDRITDRPKVPAIR
jgi:hypothetical protein